MSGASRRVPNGGSARGYQGFCKKLTVRQSQLRAQSGRIFMQRRYVWRTSGSAADRVERGGVLRGVILHRHLAFWLRRGTEEPASGCREGSRGAQQTCWLAASVLILVTIACAPVRARP
jgi:hypothetical protein